MTRSLVAVRVLLLGLPAAAADLTDVGREAWPLLAFFGVVRTAAILRFRKRLDREGASLLPRFSSTATSGG